MGRIKKIFFLSVLFPMMLFLSFELAARVFLSVRQGNIQPLYYGIGEWHRLLFEDGDKIIKKQGTFLYRKEIIEPHAYDLTQGEVIRGKYVTYKKPKRTLRILVYGASSVFSVTTPAVESFPHILEKLLNETEKKYKVQVVNMGKPSAQSSEIVKLQEQGFRFEHDIEIFYHFYNDINHAYSFGSKSKAILFTGHKVLYRLSLFYASLNHFVPSIIQSTVSEQEAADHNYRTYIKNVHHLIKNALSKKIKPILVKQALDYGFVSLTSESFQHYTKLYAKARMALDDIAGTNGVDVIDAATFMLETYSPIERKDIFYDVVHLTARGNRILARLIKDRLSPIVNGI